MEFLGGLKTQRQFGNKQKPPNHTRAITDRAFRRKVPALHQTVPLVICLFLEWNPIP